MLDFYRGTLSARLLGVYVRKLSVDSALVLALNGGVPPFKRTDHLVADLWALWARKDHPARAEMEAKARTEAKQARVIELKTEFQRRKQRYGLG